MNTSEVPLILNVDDVEEARYIRTRILRAAGHEVIEADCGNDALRIVRERLPHLVVLDVKLPDINGLEVCRLIKSDPTLESVLVLQTSAHFTDPSDKVKGLTGGADSYLAYPIDADELTASVTALLRLGRAQAQLRRERDQSRRIFKSMGEGFALLDHNWVVLEMNDVGLRLSQRNAQEVIGHSHWDVWPGLKDNATEEFYRRVMETRKSERTEILYTLPNGKQVWIEVRAYPASDGELAFFFRDISELKAAQEELKEAVKRKDEFLAMLAHELRNPLAPISAAAEVLQFVEIDRDRVRQTSDIIARQVEHMSGLVEDLLDMSRITKGIVKLENAPVDIRDTLAEALEQVAPLIRSRGHHLLLHLTPDETLVMGDRKRLVQLLTNILNNAAKFTPEGGNIKVSTEVQNGTVLIDVIDDGIGIEPKLVSQVFDLFTQAERTSDRSSGGLGLGLALVKSLTALHGGTVTCDSAGLGHGSRFTIGLPRLLADMRIKRAQGSATNLQQNAKALRIMVVEDNLDAAATLAMLLEASGHQVSVEHSACGALELAKTERPQVFLLDIGLPEMDGSELAQRLRTQPETAKSILIAVTGYSQESERIRALAAGFDHYLVKPINKAQLFAILAEVAGA